MPSFLIRSHGMATSEIGTWLGLIIGVAGGIGIVMGGRLADRWGARDPRWYLWVVAVALAAGTPFAVAVYLAPTATQALLISIIPVMLGTFYQATTFSQTQGLVGLRMRSVAAAVLLFIINIIGLGAGPTTVGVFADLLLPRFGGESLRYALLICALVNVWAAAHYYIAGRHLAADLAVQTKLAAAHRRGPPRSGIRHGATHDDGRSASLPRDMRVPCVISTLRPDGHPITSATWYGFIGDDIVVSTPAQRNKARNVRQDARISFIVDTKERPYRGVAIEGVAEIVADPDGAIIGSIIERYLGGAAAAETRVRLDSRGERVILRIRAQRVRPWAIG